MPARRRRPSTSLSAKTVELALAVPQVVAHRLLRMAHAGPQLSARDRTEFARMIAEKNSAFAESWSAMSQQMLQSQRTFAAALALATLATATPRTKRRPHAASHALAEHLQHAALAVVDKGLAPVHRRAVANAKRLARTRLR